MVSCPATVDRSSRACGIETGTARAHVQCETPVRRVICIILFDLENEDTV